MRMSPLLAAAAGLLFSGLSAYALDSAASAPSALAPDAQWKKIGDFCGIGSWHPAVEKCELSADAFGYSNRSVLET